MKVMLTGATGHFGSKVVEHLLASDFTGDIAVSVRTPEKAKDLKDKGIEVRQGDFDQPESLDFSGVDRLLIVSTDGDNETRKRQHKAAVDAAVKAGVSLIAYTSLVHADTSELVLAEVHKETEQYIKESGVAYTFLRNNWYLENELDSVKATMSGAPWVTSAPDGRVGWALRGEYAQAAAKVLTSDGHENKIYELSGKPLSQSEFAAMLSRVLDINVPYKEVTDDEYAQMLKDNGVPEGVVGFVVAIQQGIQTGALDVESDDLATLLGHEPTTAEDGIKTLII